ncbi:MAG: hypothetical protein ACOC28_06465 [Alkalispirochaetaceae bacterium]
MTRVHHRPCPAAPALLLILFVSLNPLAAQESAPQPPVETEILLPPEFFDLGEAPPGEVEALLPELPSIPAPTVNIPLPEGPGLREERAAFSLPEPEEIFLEDAAPGGSSVFTTGTVGAGSVNYILGELALYKIGEDPRFRFEFLHRGLDGFSFNDPGTGHFERRDELSAWVAAEAEQGGSVAFSADYREREIGFQGRPTFYSAEFRGIEGLLELSYPLADRASAYFAGQAGYLNRLYTVKDPSLDPPQTGESRLEPRLGVALDYNRFRLDLYGRYALRSLEGSEVPSLQQFAGGVEAEYEFPRTWYASSSVELLRESDRDFLFPFDLTLGFDLEDQFSGELSGGLDHQAGYLRDLWEMEPLLAPSSGGELPSQDAWFLAGNLGWRPPFTGAEIEVTGRYETRRDAVVFDAYDPATDFLPFSLEEREQLTTGINATWQPDARFELTGGWQARFLDRHFLERSQEGRLSIDYKRPGRVWGGRSEITLPFYDELVMPFWNLEAYFSPLEAVEVRLGLEDLLAVALEEGRGYGASEPLEAYPFVQPGFLVRLETRITL